MNPRLLRRLWAMHMLHEDYPDMTFPAMIRDFLIRHRPKPERVQAQARREWRERLARKAARNKIEARRIPLAVRRDVLRTGTCTYCGGWANVVDHVIPVAQGGTRRRRNLVATCSRCNFDKLDFTPEQWREWRLSVGREWPPRSGEAELGERLTALGDSLPPPGLP